MCYIRRAQTVVQYQKQLLIAGAFLLSWLTAFSASLCEPAPVAEPQLVLIAHLLQRNSRTTGSKDDP
uniref:Uncharacterized protein n=1 Tax=Arundo donax TaxID=35708 RepID=A0A0A9G9S4_ARUDO